MYSSFIGKVLDNYRILERLGIGGMGVVFKAIHIKLDKIFAIKIIAPGLAMNEHFIKRFQTEAKALAKFEDINIVRIYDLRSADDQWFIVMEYVKGTTLTDKILKDGAFHWLEALPIIKQVLSAIGHAHEVGIIHRDIKPNNILLDDKGTVKITDFGLAKDQTKTTNTLSVTSGGTLYYMSPEHVKGFSFIDARSDLYSIGMTFYEMLTGIVPFQNIKSDFDIRESIVRKEFEKPRSINPTIPTELEMIVIRSISKNPDDRYQTADDMIQAIIEFETQYGIAEKEQSTKKELSTKLPLDEDKPIKKVFKPLPRKEIELTIPIKRKPVLNLVGLVILLAVIVLIVIEYKLFLPSSKPSKHSQKEITLSSLTISSNPSAAWIILNGDSIGQTPLKNHVLNAGQYSVRISKDHYHSIDTTIALKPDSNQGMFFILQTLVPKNVQLKAEKLMKQKNVNDSPVFASLSIQSEPSSSEIWINGKLKGKTPLHLKEIVPGNHLVEIRKEGYKKYAKDLNLVVGNNQRLNAKLTPFSGGLSVIKDPPSAKVLIDGKEMSSQNSSVLEVDNIPIGKHHVEVVNPGYATFKEEIEIKLDDISNINAQLVRLEGELSIQIRPWGSIYIDGQLQKSSADIKYTVRLPVDKYDIKVAHPILGIWQKEVQVKEDKNIELFVNFKKEIRLQVNAVDKLNNPISGDIFIDGKQIEQHTPGEILLRVGIHKINVKKTGYYAEGGEKEFLNDTGSNKSITFTLKKVQ